MRFAGVVRTGTAQGGMFIDSDGDSNTATPQSQLQSQAQPQTLKRKSRAPTSGSESDSPPRRFQRSSRRTQFSSRSRPFLIRREVTDDDSGEESSMWETASLDGFIVDCEPARRRTSAANHFARGNDGLLAGVRRSGRLSSGEKRILRRSDRIKRAGTGPEYGDDGASDVEPLVSLVVRLKIPRSKAAERRPSAVSCDVELVAVEHVSRAGQSQLGFQAAGSLGEVGRTVAFQERSGAPGPEVLVEEDPAGPHQLRVTPLRQNGSTPAASLKLSQACHRTPVMEGDISRSAQKGHTPLDSANNNNRGHNNDNAVLHESASEHGSIIYNELQKPTPELMAELEKKPDTKDEQLKVLVTENLNLRTRADEASQENRKLKLELQGFQNQLSQARQSERHIKLVANERIERARAAQERAHRAEIEFRLQRDQADRLISVAQDEVVKARAETARVWQQGQNAVATVQARAARAFAANLMRGV